MAEDVDRLVTIDLNRRGVIRVLYSAARERAGRPLVLAAAQALTSVVKPGTAVLLATGWPDRPWITPSIGELDGPPGAALLARSLHRALGAIPILLIEEELQTAMVATARAAGFAVVSPEQARAAYSSPAPLHAAAVLSFPKDKAAAARESRRLIDTYRPTAVIAVEKGSANKRGIIHNARGIDTTACMAKVDELIREARRSKIVSVGIGDGGNEVGMGSIAGAIRAGIRYGARCACPCRGGIAPSLSTDHLVTASVSNWGAAGVAAGLAVLTGRAEALHDEAMERRMLREAADAGLIDGNTGYVDPGADGLADTTHAAVLTLLRQLVTQALHPTGLAQTTPPNSNPADQRRTHHVRNRRSRARRPASAGRADVEQNETPRPRWTRRG